MTSDDAPISDESVTPEKNERVIAEELYFTAADGVRALGAQVASNSPAKLLTICVLILRNGFTVTGESACVSPENFSPSVGRKIARQHAVNKIWLLEAYLLAERIAEQRQIQKVRDDSHD